MKNKLIMSLLFKSFVVIFALLGVIFSIFNVGSDFMGGLSSLLYFTIQSNIWIMIYVLVEFILVLKKQTLDIYNTITYNVKIVLTVAITLTMSVYLLLLAPSLSSYAWSVSNIFLHIIVPIFAILDLLINIPCRKVKLKYKYSLYSLIPPMYYLIFAIIGFYAPFDYAYGNNYPYFFFNFTSPAGIFGFSNVSPYYLGSFYWICILALVVFWVSSGYIWLLRKMSKTKNEKMSLT